MYVVTAYVEYGEEPWIVGVYSKASKAMAAAREVEFNIARRVLNNRRRKHYWDVDVEFFTLDGAA